MRPRGPHRRCREGGGARDSWGLARTLGIAKSSPRRARPRHRALDLPSSRDRRDARHEVARRSPRRRACRRKMSPSRDDLRGVTAEWDNGDLPARPPPRDPETMGYLLEARTLAGPRRVPGLEPVARAPSRLRSRGSGGARSAPRPFPDRGSPASGARALLERHGQGEARHRARRAREMIVIAR
jgi:hypothetical protein